MESKLFLQKVKKKIVAYPDTSLDKDAQVRLDWLYEKFASNIPSEFKDNRAGVALYSPAGAPEKAYGLVLDPQLGSFDCRNTLNDLTGKAWVKFSSSWFIFNALPSDLAEERQISASMADHPATYSPTMIEEFIRFFTKEGMTVLDPFVGIGSTLVAAKRNNRFGIGIELNPKYAELAKLRIGATEGRVITGSSEGILEMNLPLIDFSISSPPYWDVLNRSTKDFRTTREKKDLDTSYSDNLADMGNVEDYPEFLARTSKIYRGVFDLLKDGGYMVVIIKNVKKSGRFYPLAWDLSREISEYATLKDEKIWIQDKVSLAPYGYPHSWTSNIIHHYCLIFQKTK